VHLLSVFSLRNRALIALVTIVVGLFGALALNSLKQELIPSISFPQVIVITQYPGAAPAAVEEDVSTPIETAIQAVPGLEESNATSNTGFSLVSASFEFGTDIARAEQRVQLAVNRLQLPDDVERALESNEAVKRIAEKYQNANNFLYLGRHYNFPTALEGALKLKEISYIHAEGYPAAEMKHGPIALVDENTPSVFIMQEGFVYEKVLANLEEIKARGGPVIAVVGEGDTKVHELADDIIEVPSVENFVQPIVSIIPLQLMAYHIALLRGCDVDKPRNLAKSVTVE